MIFVQGYRRCSEKQRELKSHINRKPQIKTMSQERESEMERERKMDKEVKQKGDNMTKKEGVAIR